MTSFGQLDPEFDERLDPQTIGIVMAISKVTEDDAFAVLAKISQRQNRKLRMVADDVVLTGTF